MRLVGTGLAAVRGGRPVFSGVGFSLAAGAALVVTGPNGAGKSTLLRILAGLLRAEAGEIRLDGGSAEASVSAQCAYVGHSDAIKPALSARENLDFWSAFLGGGDPAAALEAMRLGHLADIPAGLLSAGQKRRLGLARLALAHRAVWLLDEPTVSLDARAQGDLQTLMRGHLAAGGLIMAATHLDLGLEGAGTLTLGGRA